MRDAVLAEVLGDGLQMSSRGCRSAEPTAVRYHRRVEIIPAIDIRGGRCVRLTQGDYARETVFGVDPVAMAQHWASEGAGRLHVVDLDAAREGRPVNDAVIRRIIDETELKVQVAGGMRPAAAIDRWAQTGADRIVVGTLAVEEPDAIEAAVRRYGERIVIAIDAREGRVAVRGWLETSKLTVGDVVREMARRGVRRFICTDISRDGMMQHPDFDRIAETVALVREACPAPAGEPVPLICSGGVPAVEDVVRLADYGVEGVIIGRALYDGSIDLGGALRALAVGDDW